MEPGQSVGQHILLEFLGDGGMGEVWKAQHTRTGRIDAIKFLRVAAGVNRDIADRFLNEARVQSHLHHPNIVPVFDAFEVDGMNCIVMKLVDGENLETRLMRLAPRLMPTEQVLSICLDVLAALNYAHTLKPLPPPAPQVGPVIHRDLKPSNILIDSTGRAMLADFGIAFAANGVRLTQAGTTLGTAFYMSPEQITDPSKVDARSDIYSFGCVLYELLTGRPPFGSETETDFTVKTRQVKEMPLPPHKLNRDVPMELQWIVLRALNKDPENRFASAAEMAAEIEDAFPTVTKRTPAPVSGNTHINQGRQETILDLQGQQIPAPPVTPWSEPPQSGRMTAGTGGSAGASRVTADKPPVIPSPHPPPPQVVTPPVVIPPPVGQNRSAGKRSKLGLWIGIVALLLLLAGAGTWYFWPTEHILLSLKGSTSVGDELAPKLAEAYLRDQLKAEKTGSKVAGKDAKGRPYLHVWGQVPGERGLQVIEIYATGSGDAFKCLAAKNGPDHCDVGMASRPINDKDRHEYPSLRNLTDSSTEHVIALDGIAVVVNPRNPVSKLTIAQVRSIYSGQITNWREVGGNDASIELFERKPGSGTLDMFNEKVMGKDAQGKAVPTIVAKDHQIEGSSEIVDAVLRSEGAIGYVSSPLVRDAKALSISDGSSPALLPSQLAVVTENYPICRRLLLYNRFDADEAVSKFLKYVTSEAGQKVVSEAHYVDLTPRVFRVDAPDIAPPEYKAITSSYELLGASFHFSSGQAKTSGDPNAQLDNLAAANVARVQTLLAQHGGSGDDILLVGYADNQPGAQSFESLGLQRANSVAESLRPTDVLVPKNNIRTFGAQLPVASNDSPEGRSKNRRVEVWVRKGVS